MPKNFLLIAMAFLCFELCAQEFFNYPLAEKDGTSELIFGQTVADPYRWMEKPSPKLDQWLHQQTGVLEEYKRNELKNFSRVYSALVHYAYSDFQPLIKQGNQYYFYQYINYHSSPSLYQQASYHANSRNIINPDRFEERGEEVGITNFKVSGDERFIAFSLSRSGSDWREIRIRDMQESRYLDDVIKWVKYSDIGWKDDGFFYWGYDTPEVGMELLEQIRNPRLFYHQVGTSQEEDQLIFEIKDRPYSKSYFQLTTDEKYLLLYTFKRTGETYQKVILSKNLDQGSTMRTLLSYPDQQSEFSIIDHIDGKLYMWTNHEANNYRVLVMDAESGALREVVPEQAKRIEKVNIINNKIVVLYYSHGQYMLAVFDLEGKLLITEDFEEGFNVSGFEGTPEDKETLYRINSFYLPSIYYKINFKENTIEPLSATKIIYDHKQFETRHVKYPSKDGTHIPMYITYKKGLDLTSGDNPLLLYGYGGFGISLTPHFDPGYVLFLNSGGILATPQIRGGGELGTSWHEAGKTLNKQNSFDDFIAAAEFLIKARMTNSNRIAITGGSNGGLLVGSAITQRPDLFKVAVPEMGVFDMLRYDKFGNGLMHHDEYGSPDDSVQFLNLLSYSPYHNVKNSKKYPPTLLVTGDHDDRVPPLHSYKFLARLQETSDTTPFLLNLQSMAGHYGSSKLKDRNLYEALKWSFILKHLDMEVN